MDILTAALTLVSLLKIPSMILYIMVWLVLIWHRKELNAKFFDICISLGVADFIFTFINTLNYAIRTYIGAAKVQEWSPSIRITYSYFSISVPVLYGSYLGQMGGVLAMTVNRFTAVVLAMKHEQIWRGTTMLVTVLCVQWAASVLFIGAILVYPGVQLIESNFSYSFGYWYTTEANANAWAFYSIYDVSVALAITVMYICMIVKAVSYRRNITARLRCQPTAADMARTTNERKKMMLENKLVMFGMVLGSCVTFYAVWDVGILLGSFSQSPVWLKTFIAESFLAAMYKFSTLVDAVFVFSNPFLLLICSTAFQTCFRKYVGCGA